MTVQIYICGLKLIIIKNNGLTIYMLFIKLNKDKKVAKYSINIFM